MLLQSSRCRLGAGCFFADERGQFSRERLVLPQGFFLIQGQYISGNACHSAHTGGEQGRLAGDGVAVTADVGAADHTLPDISVCHLEDCQRQGDDLPWVLPVVGQEAVV